MGMMSMLGLAKRVKARMEDNGDGTYQQSWQSETAGKHSVSVSIDEEPVLGSPFTLELLPGAPALDKTVIAGGGLERAKAGEHAAVRRSGRPGGNSWLPSASSYYYR